MSDSIHLIFVVEANTQSKSDYLYIRKIMDKFYTMRLFKMTPVYSGSKGNLTQVDGKIINAIQNASYRNNYVIIVADVDSQTNPAFALNPTIQNYCSSKGYDLVWMNETIEDVFLGKVINSGKKKTAEDFVPPDQDAFDYGNVNKMNALNIRKTSNLFCILDKYISKFKK